MKASLIRTPHGTMVPLSEAIALFESLVFSPQASLDMFTRFEPEQARAESSFVLAHPQNFDERLVRISSQIGDILSLSYRHPAVYHGNAFIRACQELREGSHMVWTDDIGALEPDCTKFHWWAIVAGFETNPLRRRFIGRYLRALRRIGLGSERLHQPAA